MSPADGGDRPHLHLHVNARDLRDQPTTDCPTHGRQTSFDDIDDDPHDNTGRHEHAAHGNTDHAPGFGTAAHDNADSAPGSGAADHGAAHQDSPGGDCACGNQDSGAAAPVDYAELLRDAHKGWLSWTGPLSIAAARRIGCDCVLTPIVLDDNDAPLNLGRTSRVVSRRLRRAVLARDHGCAFPMCGRPAEWCQIHHIRHWIDGGPTDLDNLVMLCGHHHRLLHHSDWEVVMGTDRHPWFVPPAHHDPTRTQIPANGRASPQAA